MKMCFHEQNEFMNKISFCDENREKRNAATGSRNTKSPCGAIINQTGTHSYIYSAPKSAGKFFVYLCHIANLRILCHEKHCILLFFCCLNLLMNTAGAYNLEAGCRQRIYVQQLYYFSVPGRQRTDVDRHL